MENQFCPYPPNPFYEVDCRGNVRSSATLSRMGVAKGAPLTNHWKHTRYVVVLSQNGKREEVPVGEMVAHTFLDPPPSRDAIIRYKDGNPRNLSVENLEWQVATNGVPGQLLRRDEQARLINGFPGYWVTDHGRVYSAKRQIWLLPYDSQLHLEVSLSCNGKLKRRSLPKFVAEHFPEVVGEMPRPNSPMLHRDGDRKNCRADNLEWTTQQALLKNRGQVRHSLRRKAEMPEEPERGAASNLMKFLLREYGNALPDAEPSKRHRYYYIDARFRPLCALCATERAQAQLDNLDQVDENFPVNQHILFPPKAVLSWDIRLIVCTDCERTVEAFAEIQQS